MLEGGLHVLHERVGIHHAADLHDGGQHGGVGEVFAQLFLRNLAGVDGADPALIALQQGAQLSGRLAKPIDQSGNSRAISFDRREKRAVRRCVSRNSLCDQLLFDWDRLWHGC